jgi:peptide/nickel transport system substrate-binding protein
MTAMAVLALAACTGGEDTNTPTGTASAGSLPRGGTIKVGTTTVSPTLDPQKNYYEWETYRCCLLRTLLSYRGLPADEGGNEVQPDLATEMPSVSDDGLTWTFHLKDGLMFAPPFQDQAIDAASIIRAVEREANPKASVGGYSFYYSPIVGFDDMYAGKADSIKGLSAPDPLTLEVQLSAPAGDLPYLFTLNATAPIPEGATDGHDLDYGRFLVSSGPYMIEGADVIDYSLPASEQEPASGYRPGQYLVMVRNPSWDPSTDELRAAYVNRIEISYSDPAQQVAEKVQRGEYDVMWEGGVPPPIVRTYLTDPALKDLIHVSPTDRVEYLSMNLALPPFDDIHVRKAVNLAIDKKGLQTLAGGPTVALIQRHIVPDSLLDDLLKDYNPYPSQDDQGDIQAAQAEIAKSKYDTNQDGECDAPECKDVFSLSVVSDPYPKEAAAISQQLAKLGITLNIKSLEAGTQFNQCNDPARKIPFCLASTWAKDFPDATTFAGPLFGSESIGPNACCNFALVGATSKQLGSLGYDPSLQLPSVDAKVDECQPLVGQDRVACWAEFDKQVMEEVVPWVPYLRDNTVEIISDRVLNYRYSVFSNGMALDQVALQPS